MKKHGIPEDIEPCCELCEHFVHMDGSGESLCRYKNRLRKVDEFGVCRHFSFNIFAYKPLVPTLPKAFDFTKI